jgi:hypothetical protein
MKLFFLFSSDDNGVFNSFFPLTMHVSPFPFSFPFRHASFWILAGVDRYTWEQLEVWIQVRVFVETIQK